MSGAGILRKVDAVTVRVPDIDAGIHFYVDVLGHRVKWRNDAIGQAGVLDHGERDVAARSLYDSIGGQIADQGDTTNYWWNFERSHQRTPRP